MNNLKPVLNWAHIPKGDLGHLLILLGKDFLSILWALEKYNQICFQLPSLYPIIKCLVYVKLDVLFEPNVQCIPFPQRTQMDVLRTLKEYFANEHNSSLGPDAF